MMTLCSALTEPTKILATSMSPHALHRHLWKEMLPDEFDRGINWTSTDESSSFGKICAEEKLKMGNRVKHLIGHEDAFSAVIACWTTSGQFSTAQPEKEQPAGSRGAERWLHRTCKMSSARAAHGKPPSFLYKNNTKKRNWLKWRPTLTCTSLQHRSYILVDLLFFLHVALWTYHLLSHHLGWFFF